MNVFEDLIDELKNENLLEDTVIDVKRPAENVPDDFEIESSGQIVSEGFEFVSNSQDGGIENAIDDDPGPMADVPQISAPVDDREFFRKRAMDEVSSLQMVEHVLAGVEREHIKVPAATYDDLEVKKALHRFIKVSGDPGSDEHAEAEFDLLQETQRWHSALSARDRNVSVANIRRFCENSRPVLSSQALMALARFYRNSSFSEEVRGKFDFVMTRLFSRDAGFENRKLLFKRVEMIGHIKTLYANWSSINYHESSEHKAEIELAVQQFDDLVRHFESAETFDDLLNADVFGNVRQYKEGCGELFYMADVAAAAIECNVRLGNRYVELILKERAANGASALESKYGHLYDNAASAAANKTLLLSELLKQRPEEGENTNSQQPAFEQESFALPSSAAVIKDVPREKRTSIVGVNRWLVLATILVAIVSSGIYVWADKFAGGSSAVSVANEVDLEGTELKVHLSTMRISHETAYGVTKPSWDAMNENDQREFLKKVFEFAKAKGAKKVNLLNYKGKTVAFASQDRFEMYGPN